MQQDVDFALRQLVDIGLRALSAAINDPTTAIEVTLRLGGLLRRLLVRDLPAVVTGGRDGRRLVRPWELSHDDYIAHAFDELRQAAVEQPHVVAALLRVLRMLVVHVEESDRPEHVPALRQQTDLLLADVELRGNLLPAELERLRAVATGTDPADRSHEQ